MKIQKVVEVTDVESFRAILGPCIIEHEIHKWGESTINLCFERLDQGIRKFNLKEKGMAAEDFMIMHSLFNGHSNVVAFKHRCTRNYVYWLDATGILVIPVLPDAPFKHGEFHHCEDISDGGDNHA